MNTDFAPDWPNLDLGHIPNQKFAVRFFLLIRVIPMLIRQRAFLQDADVIIARNFDLLVLSWVARAFCRPATAPLIYECLDIHSLFTGTRWINRTMRFLERALLRMIKLLWVSSPGFMSGYFKPQQKFSGPFELIENKLWFEDKPTPRPKCSARPAGDGPIVLGWVGSIRCQKTFELLEETARRLGDHLRVEIHGNVHHHALTDFDRVVAGLGNVSYLGPYSYPDGLAGIYARCDVVWAQDLWQRGGNSDWLLPNRIYEASWFGCPSIAVADTETGRKIASSEIGFTIAAPTVQALSSCLKALDRSQIRGVASQILQMVDEDFRLMPADIERALAPVLGERESGAKS